MARPATSFAAQGRGFSGYRYCPPAQVVSHREVHRVISVGLGLDPLGPQLGLVAYVLQEGGLRLRYTHTRHEGAPQRIDEVIPIVRTPTPFGGQRHWFACPACSRRCRLIYGGSHFRCRHCHGARYTSQYESLPLRISRRRWRIQRKLERLAGKPWPFGLDDGFPPKPRRMRWAEYQRLQALDQRLAAVWHAHIAEWLKRTDPARTKGKVPASNRSDGGRPTPGVMKAPSKVISILSPIISTLAVDGELHVVYL